MFEIEKEFADAMVKEESTRTKMEEFRLEAVEKEQLELDAYHFIIEIGKQERHNNGW